MMFYHISNIFLICFSHFFLLVFKLITHSAMEQRHIQLARIFIIIFVSIIQTLHIENLTEK